MVLIDDEVFRMFEYFGIALEGLHDDVEILGEGDVVDLAQSDDHMLDVHSCEEGLRAEFLFAFMDDEASVDDVGLVEAPVEGFEVVGVFILADPAHIILIDHLTCLGVGECAVETILDVVLALGGFVLPISFYKLGCFYFDGWFGSH